MTENEIAAVIGSIYDAALDPDCWPEALERTSHFVNGGPAMLFSQDPLRRSGQLYSAWNVDARFATLYFEEILATNPLLPLTAFVAVGDPIAISTLMPYEELQASRFYRDYMQPQGMVDIVGSVLNKSAVGHVIVGFGRDAEQGLVDVETARRIGMLAPHYCRAVSIGNLIERQRVEAETLVDVLDGLAAGVFLIDAAGQVVRVNRRGRAMLAERSVLGLARERLASNDPRTSRQLRDVLRRAAAEPLAVAGSVVELFGAGGERYLAHVLPLSAGASDRRNAQGGPIAAVFVREAVRDAASSLETAANVFRLTPAEVRVLHALMLETKGVAAVAALTGIAVSTVKTHLSHLFQKTGTSRQSELVKLVASCSSPIGGADPRPNG
jgi:DNA-binding CsgD family transcriptional regulator/PAS domain-containing protein